MSELTTIPTVMKMASKVCPPFLKWYYSEERLGPLLLLDVLGQGESVCYQFISQEAWCSLAATNVSPFDFILDRIQVVAVFDTGGSFTCSNQMPQMIKGTKREMIYLRGNSAMTQDVANSAKNAKSARVDISAHVITSIRSFPIRRSIDHIQNIRFYG